MRQETVRYRKVVCRKTVIDYETRTEQCTTYVTLQRKGGDPYQVKKVCYREVKVPVKKVVIFVKYVPVRD